MKAQRENTTMASTEMREAIQALADDRNETMIETISSLQAGAAKLDDGEATLELLCELKSEILEEESK